MASNISKLLDPVLADPERAARVAAGVAETREEIAAHRLAELRRSLGLTQSELAELIGRSQSHMSLLETGNVTMSVELLQRIADAVGAQLEIVMIFNNDNNQRRVPRRSLGRRRTPAGMSRKGTSCSASYRNLDRRSMTPAEDDALDETVSETVT